MSERELKQERSIPVQGRIDIKSLAELDAYWSSIGVEIRSMSQLLAWSVDAFHSILKKNNQLPQEFELVADCHNYLERRNLYQTSMKKRAIAKVNAAMRFENLRFEGINPATYDSREYNIVHNSTSVKPYEDNRNPYIPEDMRRRIEEGLKIADERRMKKNIEEQKRAAMKSSRIVEDPSEDELTQKHMRQASEENEKAINMPIYPETTNKGE